MSIERLKEWLAPTQKTIFKINEKALVGCKATDGYTVEDGKIKIPEVCWMKREKLRELKKGKRMMK